MMNAQTGRLEIQDTAAGIIGPFRPTVTLYWELVKPTSTDYSFALIYRQQRACDRFDRPVGTVVPATPTSQWERVGFMLNTPASYKKFEGANRSAAICCWPFTGAQASSAGAEGLPDSPQHTLDAARDHLGRVCWSLPFKIAHPVWRRTAAQRLGFSGSSGPGDDRIVGPADDGIITRPYILAVHLYSAAIVAQADSRPHNGQLLSDVPVNYSFSETLHRQPIRHHACAGADYESANGWPDAAG
jgi:hypothetical protein